MKKLVKEDNTRFGLKGNNIECGYCTSRIGEEHKKGCVCRKKNINVKIHINMVMDVPEDWDKEQIDFHYNKGTWCSSNIIEELESLDKKIGCLCQFIKVEYINDIKE